jgi:S-adenosylmethionine/arginine decarboxylase-like enzyme
VNSSYAPTEVEMNGHMSTKADEQHLAVGKQTFYIALDTDTKFKNISRLERIAAEATKKSKCTSVDKLIVQTGDSRRIYDILAESLSALKMYSDGVVDGYFFTCGAGVPEAGVEHIVKQLNPKKAEQYSIERGMELGKDETKRIYVLHFDRDYNGKMLQSPYAYHVISHVEGVDPKLLNGSDVVYSLMEESLKEAGIVPLQGKSYQFFGLDKGSQKIPQGVTAVIATKYGDAAIHSYPEFGQAMLDWSTVDKAELESLLKAEHIFLEKLSPNNFHVYGFGRENPRLAQPYVNIPSFYLPTEHARA